MDRLGAFRIFVCAVETGSFVAAGRALGISASAVGKAIARLEERLGARLLQRDTHRLGITPEGSAFLARCRVILAEYEAAEAELARGGEGLRGALRIGAPAWATMLGVLVDRFAADHPGVRLEIDFDDRLVDVIGERYDVVFRTGTLDDSALVSRLVGRFAHAVVASPAYLRRHGRPENPAALASHRCIHRRRVTDGKLEPWPLAGAPPSSSSASLIVSTVEGRIALALRGSGIACVPAPCVTDHLRNGALAALFASNMKPTSKLHALWARTPSAALRAFVALLPQVTVPGFAHRSTGS